MPTAFPALLRFLRLALLLSVLPFIRGCDDASGMTQTLGFPLPYTSAVNGRWALAEVAWLPLAGNLLYFVALAGLLATRLPDLLARLAALRLFVTLAVYGVLNLLFGWIVFFVLLLPAIGLNEIVELDLALYMDIASRVLLVGLVTVIVLLTDKRAPAQE